MVLSRLDDLRVTDHVVGIHVLLLLLLLRSIMQQYSGTDILALQLTLQSRLGAADATGAWAF
jgi:hypothetical protein